MLATNKKKMIALLVVAVLLSLSYFVFHKKEDDTVDKTLGVYTHTTTSGKKITIQDAHPEGANRSMVIIMTEGFQNNTPVALKKNKLTNVYFSDLNNDGSDEVVLVFTSQTSSSSSEALVYTTADETQITNVDIPTITEKDKAPGELFDGYVGEDTFFVEKNRLFRTFSIRHSNEEGELPAVVTQGTGEETPVSQDSEATPLQPEGGQVPLDASSSPSTLNTTSDKTERKTVTYSLIANEGFYTLEPQAQEETKQLIASTTATLASTSWKWLSLNNKGVVVVPPADEPLTLSFDMDGTFTASTTCETFTGGYVATGNVVRLGSIVVIPKETPTCSSQISSLKDSMPNVESFVVQGDQLMISLEGNEGVILFTRQ